MSVQILPCKPGAISKADKKKLSDAGVIVVETDEPDNLRMISMDSEVSGTGMLYAAMKALSGTNSYNERSVFAMEIYKQVCDSWTKRKPDKQEQG